MTTLARVTGQREWSSNHGPMISIKLDFKDFQAELNTKPENVVKRLEQLESLIGKDSPEWAFEDKGTFDDGNPKPKKVTHYPGQPASSGGGGGGGKRDYVPRFTDTAEGFRESDERVDRRRSYELAIQALKDQIVEGSIHAIAEAIYNGLRKTVQGAVPGSAGGHRSAASGRPPEQQSSAPEAHTESAASVRQPSSTGAEDVGQEGAQTTLAYGEGVSDSKTSSCPPHEPNLEVPPNATGRRPCRFGCGIWVKAA